MASRISMRVEEEEMERSPAADCPLKQNSDQCYGSVMSHIFNSKLFMYLYLLVFRLTETCDFIKQTIEYTIKICYVHIINSFNFARYVIIRWSLTMFKQTLRQGTRGNNLITRDGYREPVLSQYRYLIGEYWCTVKPLDKRCCYRYMNYFLP